MKLAIIGATGFVGKALVTEALSRGHHVTAIARHAENLHIHNPLLKIVNADIFEEDKLPSILKGHDAVLSAYNPGWGNPDIYNEFLEGAKTIQQAVKKSGVKRYLVVGGAGSLEVSPGVQLVDTPEFPATWKKGALAARDYLTWIRDEKDLDWTFLSPAIQMHLGTSGIRKGTYRTGVDQPVFDAEGESKISVEDLAVALLDETEKGRFLKRRFTVAY